MGRDENIAVFEDTEKFCKENRRLKESVAKSVAQQKLVLEGNILQIPDKSIYKESAQIIVSKKRSLEAASAYRGQKVCVHNFASASNPGGGLTRGANAQEECLCRCSSLYFCLNTREMWNGFYQPHRYAQDPLHNDDIIWTPNVAVFKDDHYNLLDWQEWKRISVITCAAPNLRDIPSNMMNPYAGNKAAEVTYDGLRALISKRVKRVFEVAIANKAEILILGAWGCGAFRNPPQLVAEVFAVYTEKYRKNFEVIEYAVFHVEYERANYEAFKKEMKRFV